MLVGCLLSAGAQPAWIILLATAPLFWGCIRRHQLLILGALLLGLLNFHWQQQSYHQSQPAAHLDGARVELIGTIIDLPERLGNTQAKNFGWRFRFRPETGQAVAGDLRISWYDSRVEPQTGERWQFETRLRRPRGFANPGGFDYAGWLAQQRIVANGYVGRRDQATRLGSESSAGVWLQQWRASIAEWMRWELAASPRRGLFLALALGERNEITPDQWRVLQRTGVAHLVAISGLHIGLIAALAGGLIAVLWRWLPRLRRALPMRLAAVSVGLISALIYALLAGMTLPTQRALCMVVVAAFAILLRRQLRWLDVLAATALAVLVFDPLSVLAVGFWLSFAAVAALLWLLDGRLRASGWLSGWLWAQLGLLLLLAPFLAVFFNRVVWLAPVANGLLLPLFSVLIIPITLVAALLGPLIGTPAGLLLQFADTVLAVCWQVLLWLDGLSIVASPMAAAGIGPIVLAVFGACWCVAPRGWPARWLGMLLMLPLLLAQPNRLDSGDFVVTSLDVGQGLAIVIRTADHVLVYDAGPAFRSGTDTGALVVAPYLRHLGVAQIDRLLLSHGDNDHMGGAQALLAEFTVKQGMGWQPESNSALKPLPWASCQAGQSWFWDGVEFNVLHPSTGRRTETKRNNQSCVLRITGQNHAVLLTGDIEASVERRLVAQTDSLSADILIAPHHGSRSSSTAEFVRAVGAEAVIFAAGYQNRYGFPAAEIQQRYRDEEAALWLTGEQGAITVQSQAGELSIHSMRTGSLAFSGP